MTHAQLITTPFGFESTAAEVAAGIGPQLGLFGIGIHFRLYWNRNRVPV